MKKFLFALVAFALSATISLTAQTSSATTMTGSGDTITNAGTDAVTLQVKGEYKTISIQCKIVKISGTVAGTVTLQGSVDGTNYETVDTLAMISDFVTYTATNVATQTKTFIIENNPYLYYRLSYTGSGTMAARLYGYLLPRK